MPLFVIAVLGDLDVAMKYHDMVGFWDFAWFRHYFCLHNADIDMNIANINNGGMA